MNKYKSLGYDVHYPDEIIEVKIEDIPPSSSTKVTVQCDICGKVYERTLDARRHNHDDICPDCVSEYRIRKHRAKYGVDWPFQRKEVRDKFIQTMEERFGCDNPVHSPEIREKMNKINREKFGGNAPVSDPDVLAKTLKTKFERGNQSTSKGQRYVCECVNGLLNYPLYIMSLDVALVDEKIDIEYNGSGHNLPVRANNITEEEFIAKEDKRRHQVIDFGWKLVEICNPNDKEISEEWIIDFVNMCKEKFNTTDINYISVDINTSEIKYNTL